MMNTVTVKRWRYDVDIVGSLLAIDLWKIKSAIPILKIKIALFSLINKKNLTCLVSKGG